MKSLFSDEVRPDTPAETARVATAHFSKISHELRTPLSLILGLLAEVLDETGESLKPRQRDNLQIVQRQAQRLSKVVDTLLELSHIQAGRSKARYQAVDLAALSREVAETFRPVIEQSGLQLIVDCPALDEPVYVDRVMWEKILSNLLSNACKFTPHGSIAVRLRRAGDRAELSVTDTGMGIPEAELPRLFELFPDGSEGRSGLGLPLAQALTRLHGGEIRVDSPVRTGDSHTTQRRGSTFAITLPFGKAHLPAGNIATVATDLPGGAGAKPYVEELLQRLTALKTPSSPHDTQPFHILVADDNADMRHYIERLLSPHYRVTAVADGLEALETILTHRPDLVLTDVMMPGLDGFGLLEAIRQDEELRALPVIMLSARAGEDARAEGIEAGADDYLAKPFNKTTLLALLKNNLALGQMRRKESEKAG